MYKKISILLLDDHSLFINGLKFLLNKSIENVVFKSFSSIKKIIKADLDFEKYDILISDIELPGEDVFSLFSKIKNNSSLPILVISMHQKTALIKKCKKIGIEGYILKNDDEYLIEAVTNLINGKKYYSHKICQILNESSIQTKLLSVREEEVIKSICAGESNQMIADKLFISIETVKTHKKNIKIKLGVTANHQIIDFAKKNFLL